jgi:hypothetical protein
MFLVLMRWGRMSVTVFVGFVGDTFQLTELPVMRGQVGWSNYRGKIPRVHCPIQECGIAMDRGIA